MEYLVCKKNNDLFIMTREERVHLIVANTVVNKRIDSFVVRSFHTIQDASIYIKKQKSVDSLLEKIFI